VHARAGPRRPSSAPCTVSIVCEVIEGAGPHQPPGNRSRDGKAERPDSNRLNGDPRDLIRAMSGRGPRSNCTPTEVTHCSRMIGRLALSVDRFVDRRVG